MNIPAVDLSFDQDGFAQNLENWNEETAQHIAQLDGLGALSESQFAVLRTLREHFLRFGTPPALPHVCRTTGLTPDCLSELFPDAHEAWRIAGLPNPGDEAVSYLSR